MSIRRTPCANRLRLQLLTLLLIIPVSRTVPNATLCTTTSFSSSSGYVYSENHPGSINNQIFTCWCSVSGEAEIQIRFVDVHLRSSTETCNEELRLYDCLGIVIFDSCQNQEQIGKDILLTRRGRGVNIMQLTLKKYRDSNDPSSGNFSLYVNGSRSVSVNCTANRQATVQSLCETVESNMAVIVISPMLGILGLLVIFLAIYLVVRRRKKEINKESVPPLYHLDDMSRRRKDTKLNDYGSLPKNMPESQARGAESELTSNYDGSDVPRDQSLPNGGYEDIRLFTKNQMPQPTMSGELPEGSSHENQVEHDGNEESGHLDESNVEQDANENEECLYANPHAKSHDEVPSNSNLNITIDNPCYNHNGILSN